MLHETRSCRDNLARQLRATENKLLSTKASFQHLQLLSQDQSLLEREELALRLTKATAELEEKDKRIVVWRSRRVGWWRMIMFTVKNVWGEQCRILQDSDFVTIF